MLRKSYILLIRLNPQKIMDTLSRLLSLYPLSTRVDTRCHLGAPWILNHTATANGVVPYHIVLTGEAWLDTAGQKTRLLQPGDIIVLPKGNAHSLYTQGIQNSPQNKMEKHVSYSSIISQLSNESNGPVTEILCGQFEFEAKIANPLLLYLPEILLVQSRTRTDFNGLQALVAMLRLETNSTQLGASMVVAQLSSALFALVIRAWLEQTETVTGLFAVFTEARLQAMLQAILAKPDKTWSVQEMAASCYMSRASFIRLFNRVSGTTPATFLMHIRMTQAALWLTQGTQKTAEIGETVGYQSEAAFHRVFKRYFGVGPGEYRRKARN